MDSVTWLVLLRESVDWERYLRPLIGISSNTGLVGQREKKKRFNMNEHVIGFNEEKKKSRGFRNISLRTKCFYLGQKKQKTQTLAAAHPAMLLMERLLDRLLPWKAMMVVALRGGGRVKEECSSGDRMADQGRSFVPPPETQER